MLGLLIGVVSGVGLLTFLARDQKAVQQHRIQKLKQEKEKQQILKKHQEKQAQIQKQKNSPEAIEALEKKQKQMKEKLFKGLSQSQKKLITDYMEEQRKSGKSEADIMKQAGTKAMLFFILVMLMLVFLVIAVLVVFGGDFQKIFSFFEEVKVQGKNFVYWNFPKLANATIWGSEQL